MNSGEKRSKILGVAFLLQFVTSISSGLILLPTWLVDGDMAATMGKIADNSLLFRGSILLDMLTTLGIIFLGAILYITLRKQNEKLALTAFGFYILEAALLAASKIETFSLLRFSQEYAANGEPTLLITLSEVAYETMDYVGSTLHMLAFCFGAILFYYLLDKSRLVPRALSLWGLLTVLPCLIGTLSAVFGHDLPFFIYFPYVPFEFVIGIWILVKGISQDTDIV